ncbi:hypothetical protein Syun_031492 [Stephania yunnanensis]|uniref:Uncharacterized protein n=1 Tax=Stephania yunnanensis TaxID=152371 RepID=A0AAP0HBF4_9MAGN
MIYRGRTTEEDSSAHTKQNKCSSLSDDKISIQCIFSKKVPKTVKELLRGFGCVHRCNEKPVSLGIAESNTRYTNIHLAMEPSPHWTVNLHSVKPKNDEPRFGVAESWQRQADSVIGIAVPKMSQMRDINGAPNKAHLIPTKYYTETSEEAPRVACGRGPEVAARGINRVADQAKRRWVTTSEPAEDCYDLLLLVIRTIKLTVGDSTGFYLTGLVNLVFD